jgi:tRNA-modifying protein YgfZ
MNLPSRQDIIGWQPAAWCRVRGADAQTFLQGQFTNELRGLVSGAMAYGLWLNVKGKVIADSFVLKGAAADEYWLGSYQSPAATIRERLESYIIADDVVIEDQTSGWSAVRLYGHEAAAKARALSATIANGTSSHVFRGRRTRREHTEWVFPLELESAVRSALADAREISLNEAEWRRIDDGLPAIPIDIGPSDLPNEGQLEDDAISYTKGCYLGQEIMARLKTMGQVRRHLLRVAGKLPAVPTLPAPLFAAGRQVGELRSAVANADSLIGLAMLSVMHLKPETLLAFAPDGQPALRLLDQP